MSEGASSANTVLFVASSSDSGSACATCANLRYGHVLE